MTGFAGWVMRTDSGARFMVLYPLPYDRIDGARSMVRAEWGAEFPVSSAYLSAFCRPILTVMQGGSGA